MPLINPMDPGMQKVRVQNRFESLPVQDQQNVVKIIEMGRAGEVTKDIDLTNEGIEFVASREFQNIYDRSAEPAPMPPADPNMVPMLISGLLDIIRERRQPEKPEPDNDQLGAKNVTETKICEHCGK